MGHSTTRHADGHVLQHLAAGLQCCLLLQQCTQLELKGAKAHSSLSDVDICWETQWPPEIGPWWYSMECCKTVTPGCSCSAELL